MKKNHIVSALIVLGATVALYMSMDAIIDPRAVIFPRIVLLSTGGLAVILMLQGLFIRTANEPPSEDVEEEDPAKHFPWKPVLFVLAATVLYISLMEDAGFYLSTAIYFIGLVMILARRKMTPPMALKIIVSGFVFTVVLYILFCVLLKVQMPCGIFL